MDAMGISRQAAQCISGGMCSSSPVGTHMLVNRIDGVMERSMWSWNRWQQKLASRQQALGVADAALRASRPPKVRPMVHIMHAATTALPTHIEVGQVAAAGVQAVHIQHRLRLVLVERALGGVQLAQVGANGTWGQGCSRVGWVGECGGQRTQPAAAARAGTTTRGGGQSRAGMAQWRARGKCSLFSWWHSQLSAPAEGSRPGVSMKVTGIPVPGTWPRITSTCGRA